MDSPQVARTLVDSAGGTAAHTREAIRQIGVPETAAFLADELAGRTETVTIRHAAEVQFVFDDRYAPDAADPVPWTFRVGPEGVTHRAGALPDPGAVVTQDLTELARSLYGPAADRSDATRTVWWRDHDDPRVYFDPPPVFPAVERLLAAADGRDVPGLAGLALRHGSDKWGIHTYTAAYEQHFAPFRDRAVTVVEIGVGGYDDPAAGGGSLRMWKRYFRRGLVYGVDIADKSRHREPRVHTVVADQSDPASLRDLADAIGPIDIVIDDGSHISAHVVTAFSTLFPRLNPGGLYVVEDLQTSYWPAFQGAYDDDTRTSVGFLKRLVDGLHHAEYPSRAGRPAQPTDRTVGSLHFHPNLAFVEKRANSGHGGISRLREAT
uniref:8-demethyl-8-alpha-L-rhamnosyl tetracenomycin-C 2'-O-methyltransferase n=1 Tax=Streptomyces olivaceus TaxID=47716 RepID=ELMM1_STROV|nr:RecName: Full=8-demethyl-8-alpha-L-rhamnosyl tetracenomycin-C 2'-O-methyltransferase; AltName: Full=O-methyltransferase I [Streptomyces olivaceus]CAD57139.1 O-methyltransferase I [Streptomyces olivaceus]CAP12606.1 rhamnose C2'-methyltransferase [Streptomyces olivaceus]